MLGYKSVYDHGCGSLRTALLIVLRYCHMLLLRISWLHVLALRRTLLILARCHRLPAIRLIAVHRPIADSA